MTCDEFRRRWLDGAANGRGSETATGRWGDGARGDSPITPSRPIVFGAVSANGTVRDASWAAHPDVCPACAAWERSQRALDDVLTSALFVATPPDLAARLAAIPAPAPRPRVVAAGPRLLDLLLPVILALGAIGLSGAFGALLLGAIWPIADDALQALPYVLSAQLLAYLQGLTSVFLQAVATLLLIALVVLQVAPATVSGSARSSNRV